MSIVIENKRAEEVVYQVLRGNWECPPNTTPMHRQITSNPATAKKGAHDIVTALQSSGLLAGPSTLQVTAPERQALKAGFDLVSKFLDLDLANKLRRKLEASA